MDGLPESAPTEEQVSVFQSNLSVEAKIERARTELLDLSARNRLLNVPRFSKSAKTIDVVDEKASEVFRILVTDGKTMTFLAGAKGRDGSEQTADGEELIELALPDDDERDASGKPLRHSDNKLQTRMTPNALQKRLLDLYFDARTLEEEQGVNILFLGLGTLKWVDPQNAENVRYAPLILIPVALERASAAERFKLKARPEDFASNLSLEAFLDRVHAIKLPDFSGTDDFSYSDYVEKVATSVAVKQGWSVQPDDIVLGFFSFAKFLMYRDLDATLWPQDAKFTELPLVRSLVSDGFTSREELIGEDENIDKHISTSEMTHIVDADSSQTLAIHEARRGRDLVIQGPPGTGKSQTIANIIGAAVADGKTVLFVAEKMAALEVVKRRLDQAGVGDACLELHSNKANKRGILFELQRTWDLGAPKGNPHSTVDARLTEIRDTLNAHPARLHQRYHPYELSPYQVIGQLSRLRREGRAASQFELTRAKTWSPDERSRIRSLIAELADRVRDIGKPIDHTWYGVALSAITPLDLERLTARLTALATEVSDLRQGMSEVAGTMFREPVNRISDFGVELILAHRLATCPPGMSSQALSGDVWEQASDQIGKVLNDGREFVRVSAEIGGIFKQDAWRTDGAHPREQFAQLPGTFSDQGFEAIAQLCELLPRFLTSAHALRTLLGTEAAPTVFSIGRLVSIGERVADAPDASSDAFVAAIWERGLEQAGDLADGVEQLRTVRKELEGKVSEQAWDVDLTATRSAVAIHGKRFLKFLSGEWRSAKALLRTVLVGEPSPDEMIRLLDLLHKGKQARATVREGDSLGRSAFGDAWRGEKTDPKPLQDLVLWMRSLRGVGTEARTIASRLSDRRTVQQQTAQVSDLLDKVRQLLSILWVELAEKNATLFPTATTAETVSLTEAIKVLPPIDAADKAFRQLLAVSAPAVEERLKWLELLRLGIETKAGLEQNEPIGRAAFGSLWAGASSPWDELEQIRHWVSENADIRILASRVENREGVAARADELKEQGAKTSENVAAALDYLQADRIALFGLKETSLMPLDKLNETLSVWAVSEEKLSKWAAYKGRSKEASAAGVAPIVERMEDGRTQPDDAIPLFEMAYYEAILLDQNAHDPELARFDGELHGRAVTDFANLDRERMAFSRFEVVKSHHRKIPGVTGIGPVGVLRAEMARRRGHMPIRQLMQKASQAIQALKPVFMMSPLSIAQFLPPGQLHFDLLVMDEASQIQPVDALGAVARAKQVVVVGDERQLPPTRFFSKMTSGGNDDEDDSGAGVSDIESILGLFSARGLPERMLRWHYRSRHQSLIAVSNSQFYDNKLFIVPSPYTQEAGMGLRFNFVPGGVFEEGVNKVEAKKVAEAIIKHALETPHLSLGVAAFSIKQRREIQDQLELLRRMNPQSEEFFHSHPSEPFFIKNLENVQGDERDVIFISVAYAKNAQGFMNMRFGPLGSEGGERRLNVLISRAKRRCEVYASITDEDVDTERGKGKGVFAFKLFLHYARTGRLAMAARADRDMDSVFEEQVAAALQERGYQVHPQVGIAGFFIDLAVADEATPGRYVLGIECDGAAYHDARSARDRDRLRQAVLEDHGWHIYRIWSTDWFQRPKAELEKLIAAIERAKADIAEHGYERATKGRAVQVEIVTVERTDVTEIGLLPVSEDATSTTAYVQAEPRPALEHELHEAPVGLLAGLVKYIVEMEGPIHRDEVVVRIRVAWGLQRAGNRIEMHVGNAIALAVGSGQVVRDGDFLSWAGSVPKLRDRSEVTSPSLRRIEMIPPTEIDAGIKEILESSLGASDEEIVLMVSRRLGFKATSSVLRDLIVSRIKHLISSQMLKEQNGILMISKIENP